MYTRTVYVCTVLINFSDAEVAAQQAICYLPQYPKTTIDLSRFLVLEQGTAMNLACFVFHVLEQGI